MPASVMSLFPQFLGSLEAMKIPMQASANFAGATVRSLSLGFGLTQNMHHLGWQLMKYFSSPAFPKNQRACHELFMLYEEASESLLSLVEKNVLEYMGRFHQKRLGELEFLKLFAEKIPTQDWTVEYDDTKVLLDLPGLRLIDISLDVKHRIQNFTVVFAPRAGHHSNIAERVALSMRDHGLTRMAVVEQKCAEDIPLYVDGERHDEGFDGQVEQYRKVLEHLKKLTGFPAHLIAICQPGPILMSTLILNPDLGKTFGSAGAPMHTEGENGFLTNFARTAGEDFIDRLITFFGQTVSEEHPGAGREIFDGRLQVLGFYFLGMDQHFRNLRKFLVDLKQGNEGAAERQKIFYQWYNCVHHFPSGFVRDTFKRIFIRNELIRGGLTVGGKEIGIKDYPGSVPIWALGGTKDDIAPPLQATGHMELIRTVSKKNKLTFLCEAGHMGLFRSRKILKNYYDRIVEFTLARSDRSKRGKATL